MPDTATTLDTAAEKVADQAASAYARVADAAQAAVDSASGTVDDLSEMVVRNPLPSALIAAATGAGLMALLAMMSRSSEPYPASVIPTRKLRGIDYDAIKQQIADLTDRIGKALPRDEAKQRASEASETLADTWKDVREQALDLIGQIQPQATAAVKLARDNPLWTAVIMGAAGALIGSQLLGGKAEDSRS
ncbi:MAG: hypothetical protein M3O01_04085 [Pseudomonadota bacterium]|nr:hypothetical protein [Pseudomonadota bacterium]